MNKRIKMRTLLIGGIITLFFIVIMGKVFWIQVIDSSFWRTYATENIWSRKEELPASRGKIMDRNGDVLADNAPAYNVILNPKAINDSKLQDQVVEGLHKILGKPANELLTLVNAKQPKNGKFYSYREVRSEGWMIDQDTKTQVDQLIVQIKADYKQKTKKKLVDAGISFKTTEKRSYPKTTMAAHVLGYINRQGDPVYGVESSFNKVLAGADGFISYQSDKQGVKIPKTKEVYQAPKDGSDIKLTIDDTIQFFTETAMKKAFDRLKPISMTVIAADPKTMEILGMANMPTYDPNKFYANVDPKNFINHALSSTYEPGSTFKIVTLAGVVQEGLFNPNATYQSGSIHIPGYKTPLYDVKRDGWGTLTYLQGVKHSSNVAFVKMGFEMLGKERLLQYIHNFGFGVKTGIDLPLENKGIINPQRDIEYATTTFGHGITVTPIQQVAAVAAVANGGMLLKPQIVKSTIDPTTGKVTPVEQSPGRRVLDSAKAKEVSSYLEQVVSDAKIGTGHKAYIEGYRVAGKTGTAVKPKTNGEAGYDYSKQVISFIGYAPVEDPKILVLVVIDQPASDLVSGGRDAAPVFKEIVEQSLQYMQVKKTNVKESQQQQKEAATAPNLKGNLLKEAKSDLDKREVEYVVLGKGGKIIGQYPDAGTVLTSAQRMYLLTEDSKTMEMPDFTGQSLRDVTQILTFLNVEVAASGEGYVTSQKVAMVDGKRRVTLQLKPPEPSTIPTKTSSSTSDKDENP
ncbi:penicillin-binding protein 2B [Paenibacillus shirakamiensis]|uniref:Penicillin-binding protein 2B n=1 Tax=Paenibacillus shirakamiensis TaxID=1265935 RepID=A0ABS4JDN7_9BACL|nr:penicillin-binding transpeptidase domain-containing protein [Paenibacillus shirakamiensis]MBP1999216.1 penicillin-binding protein 2B [Paenibacillus shirakamiensis]